MPKPNFSIIALTLLCLSTAIPTYALAQEDAAVIHAADTAVTVPAPPAPITDEAQRIYQSFGDAVYQVQVIDLASGKKTAIGSGFQFSADGLMGTNYHVVAEAIRKPENYRLEFLQEKGARGALKILTADVVHDLAVLRMEKAGEKYVDLGTSQLAKGTKLFSLGNPHDIGFTIVEGIYNGLSPDSFIDKIHFSGAINQGMSGGPALDHQGRVVGVNVMTGGNQIGFLVPVEPLNALIEKYKAQDASYDFVADANGYIGQQLADMQSATLTKLLDKNDAWEAQPFGPIVAPGRIHKAFKCWGAPAHQEKDPYSFYYSTCFSQDELFLSDDATTGTYSYRYVYLKAKKDLITPRFYTLYADQYGQAADSSNAGEGEVTNFKCNDDFIEANGLRWKTSFCTRRYIRYPALFDAQLYMALLDHGKTGAIVTLSAEGVTKENALAFTQRFISEIRPNATEKTEIPAPPPAESAMSPAEGGASGVEGGAP